MILGLVAAIALVAQAHPPAAARNKYDLEDEPLGWFLIKLAFTVGLILFIAYLLASYRRHPDRADHPRRADRAATRAVMASTVFGRHIYALGGNRTPRPLSGVKTKRVTSCSSSTWACCRRSPAWSSRPS